MAVTINGITYNIGDSFICAKSASGNANEAGTGGTAIPLSVGNVYYLRQVDTTYNVYPYLIATTKTGSNYLGWYKADVFPIGNYTVSYNANGGTGAPSNQTKIHNQSLTLSSTKPTRSSVVSASHTVRFDGNGGSCDVESLVANDTIIYSFENWRATDGSEYESGGQYTKNESTMMTAMWSGISSTGSITLPTAYGRTGYTFKGWSTSSAATDHTYSAGDRYTPTTSNTTLYAIWKINTYTNKIGHYLNTNNQSISDLTTFNASYGSTTVINSSFGITPPNGFQLNTTFYDYSKGGVGSNYYTRTMPYDFIQPDKSVSFRFSYIPIHYSITYKYNGGSYMPGNYNDYTIWNELVFEEPIRKGYKFLGWYINGKKTTGINVGIDNTFSTTEDLYNKLALRTTGNITVEAKWEAQGLVYIDNGNSFEAYQVYIDNGTSWDQYVPYIDNGTSWDMCS